MLTELIQGSAHSLPSIPEALKAPFPYFGGKAKAAAAVWDRFGDTVNYVEPFAGSLAVLLNRPHEPRTETVNDIDCYISNFWRALSADPDSVAHYADWPVNEADLHSRHLWLVTRSEFRQRMKIDPDFYDSKIAGWWVWGICQWIGSGWCDSKKHGDADAYNAFLTGVGEFATEQQTRPHLGNAGMGVHGLSMPRQGRPSLGDAGRGIHRPSAQLPHLARGRGIHRPSTQLPHLGNAGRGINRPSNQLPHLGNAGRGINRPSNQLPHLGDAGRGIHEYMHRLSDRLRRVRVCCGDWSRILGPSPTTHMGMTAVFLDPPYSHAERDAELYANEEDCAPAVRTWAIENGANPLLRIALCGYDTEHAMPDDWECYAWKARGGYGSQGNGRARDNAGRECIWFSPHCIKPRAEHEQLSIFGEVV